MPIVIKAKNSKENLCDTCIFCIADCDVDKGLLEFGDAAGNDNVTACDAYVHRPRHPETLLYQLVDWLDVKFCTIEYFLREKLWKL